MERSPYNLAYTLQVAQNSFAGREPLLMAKQSGCPYDPLRQSFTVPYLGRAFTVSYPAGGVFAENKHEADLITSILLLHYLSGAGGAELSGGWISFRELQSGAIYIGPFRKRAVIPLIKGFGTRPGALAQAAEHLGGKKAAYGDLSYIIPVLPRVPLLVILWYGDDEFPPNANILFNRHANAYLSTEDCAQLAGQTVYTMLKFKAE
ncbi:MAG: DUF3786 domain-containing protein [Firmicutes bacterium]|jgi:hypothetical protein|nr:DUF3786 domain-containing protein [Bacillota bacterium]